MKKFFRKIFILISLFLVFWLNNTFAETKNDNIRKEIEVLKEEKNIFYEKNKYFIDNWNEKIIKEYYEFDNKIIDLLKKENSWKNIYETRALIRWHDMLETWDILVFKYKNPPEWWDRKWVWWWIHTVTVYDRNTFVEAPWVWQKSRKIWRISFLDQKIHSEVAIIKMWLTEKEKESFKEYIDSNLLNKDYPISKWDWKIYVYRVFTSKSFKYSMSKFYCSSLVWRAHYSNWKKIDLDWDTSNDWILPIELLLSDYVRDKIEFRYVNWAWF